MHERFWRGFWQSWTAGAVAAAALAMAAGKAASAASFVFGAAISAISLLLIRESARVLAGAALEIEGRGWSRRARAGRALILGGRLLLIAGLLKLALLWRDLHLTAFVIGLGFTQAVIVVYSLTDGRRRADRAD